MPQSTAQKIQIRDREAQVVALRRGGVSFRQIGPMLASLWEHATTAGARGQLHAMEQLTSVMERIDRVGGTEAPMRRIIRVVDEATLVEATKKIEQETPKWKP
jgi:hypothetical protein